MARAAARVYITGDTSGLKKATRQAESDVSRLGKVGTSAFSGLKTAALAAGAAIGGVAVVGQIKSAVNAASDLNEEIGKSGVVFKDASREVVAFSKTTATSIGISQRAALEATGTFGNMLVPMGLARDRAAEMSTRMVALAGDMASFNNASPKDTLDALRAGLAGESEPLRRFGVFLSDARIQQEALTLGLKKGKEELTAAGKAQAIYSLILKDTKDAQGDFQRTSGSLANQQRIVAAQWENLSASLGKSLMPALTDVMKFTNNDLLPAMRRAWPSIKRVIEDVIDWIVKEVVPEVRAAVRNITMFWDEHEEDLRAIGRVIQRVLGDIAKTVRDLGRIIGAVMRGDWSKAWESGKAIVVRVVKGIVDALSDLGPRLARAARDAGAALWREFVRGFDSALASVPGSGALRRVLGLDSTSMPAAAFPSNRGAGSVVGRASGGMIPGRYRGVDDQVALVASGEAVLTPQQQAMVPGGRATLNRIFRATGGVTGGDRFATGGVVGAAAQRASSNLGEPYGKPSRGESRTGPNSWDCSGYATYVAGVNVGGTTASAYTQSMGVRDHSRYPIVWGFRKSHSGGYRGGYDEHMGVRVGGVWYQTSGGRTARTGSDGDWQEIRVPRGLERLSDADAGGPGDASVGGSVSGGARSVPRYRTAAGNLPDVLAPGYISAVRRGGGATPLTSDDLIRDRARDNTLQDRVARRGGEQAARDSGVTNPDKVALMGERSVIEVRKKELTEDRIDLVNDLKKVRTRIRQLLARKRRAIRNLQQARTRQGQERIKEGIRALNEQLTGLRDEERGLQWAIADKNAELALLGDDQASLDQEIMATPNEASADSPAAGSTGGPGELTAEQQAQIRAGQVASNENTLLREFLSTAFGPGDIGFAGGNAIGSATGGRWVPLRVDASSFAAATAAAAGGQGYVTASVVPSGA